MLYQSSVRNQRPKGFNIKKTFQVILLLVVSVWLLYQIKHSHSKPKEYGGEQKKLSSEHGSMVLGRKGDAGSSEGVDTDFDEVNAVGEGERKKDGGGGDDELDRNIEEKAQEESFINGHEDSQSKIPNDEKDDPKELETQNRESLRSEENNLGPRVRDEDEAVSSENVEEPLNKGHEDSKEGFTNIVKQEDREKEETQNDEPETSEKGNPDSEVKDRDEAVGSDKGKEEELNKGHEDSTESFTDHVEQEDREILEKQKEEPEKTEKVYPVTEVIDSEEDVSSQKGEEEALNKGHEDSKESFTDHVEQEEREKLERQNEEPENSEKGNLDTKATDRDEAVGSGKENDEGKDSKGNADDVALQHSETENFTVPGQSEIGDDLQGFYDENGVPQDAHDLLNNHSNGTTSDEQEKVTSQDHETIPSLENQTQHEEITIQTTGESFNSSQADEQTDRGISTDNLVIKQGEVKSQENGTFAEVETVSNNILEGSKTESNDNVENSSQSGDNSDVSSIKGSSENTQDANVSPESSSSSQPGNEEATIIKTIPQAENAADSKE